MIDVLRRDFLTAGTTFASAIGLGLQQAQAAGPRNGFIAASSALPGSRRPTGRGPGSQDIQAVCEVTGGGEKVYGIAVRYDIPINHASLAPDTYAAGVFPAAGGFFPGMPQETDKNIATAPARPRPVAAVYTDAEPGLRPDRKSRPGPYVIAEFHHDPDLSLPTSDSDKVSLTQDKPIRTVWSNTGRHGNDVVIRGVDDWEQNHWWWDDTRSAWLEYSIYLPKGFLAPGGENRSPGQRNKERRFRTRHHPDDCVIPGLPRVRRADRQSARREAGFNIASRLETTSSALGRYAEPSNNCSENRSRMR